MEFGINMKEVDFKKYCATCLYKDVKDNDDPCDDCLAVPARAYSHKPINYKEKKE